MLGAKIRFRRALMRGIGCTCVIALAACATSTEQVQEPPRKNKVAEAQLPIQRIPPKVAPMFELVETRPVRLVVRATEQGEVESEWWETDKKTLQVISGGGAVGALAVASVPAVMGSAAVLLGGVILATGGAVALGVEKKELDQMVAAVTQTNLPSRIESILSHHLQISSDEQVTGEPTLEVLTVSYGVIESKGQQESFCVVAEMLIRLSMDGVERYKDRVLIYPKQRSKDAPAPVCRTREVMAMNEGEAIRNTLEIYAEAMPALVQNRLPGLPWRR